MDIKTPDYHSLIDADTWAFIKRTEQWYPPDTTDCSIERQRDIYDAMCREFQCAYPAGVVAQDDDSQGVLTRHYRLQAPIGTRNSTSQIVYFHGGGFMVGGLHSHDDVCAELCASTGLDVTAVDYRLCPEHPHPAAWEDALAGIKKVWSQQREPLLLCGDSAGGNLAAAMAHQLRDERRNGGDIAVFGQVLIYPGLGGDTSSGSYQYHRNAPMLSTDEVEYYARVRLQGLTPGPCPLADVKAAPLLDADYTDLPNTLIVTAECDPLSDDGRLYRDAIVHAGGQALWVNEAGLVHGYLRARHTAPKAQKSFARIVSALTDMASGEWRA